MTTSELENQITEANKQVPRQSYWRHHAGQCVTIVYHCIREDDLAVCVLYLHGGVLWCRPLSEWQEQVMNDRGVMVPRFSRIER